MHTLSCVHLLPLKNCNCMSFLMEPHSRTPRILVGTLSAQGHLNSDSGSQRESASTEFSESPWSIPVVHPHGCTGVVLTFHMSTYAHDSICISIKDTHVLILSRNTVFCHLWMLSVTCLRICRHIHL